MSTSTHEPTPISTGSGPSPAEIGNAVVAALRAASADGSEPEEKLWAEFWDADRVESIEGMGQMWTGLPAIRAKNEWWCSENEMLGFSVSGPFVGATGFSLMFDMKVKERKSGNIIEMQEVGVYTVKDGKVVREEFMYAHHG